MEWAFAQWPACFGKDLFFYSSFRANSVKAYKHIFTSPSSVDQEPKATRSGNARIHGMRSVTRASIAYVAIQVSCQWHHPLRLLTTVLYIL